MPEPDIPQEPSPVTEYWGQTIQALMGLVLLLGAGGLFYLTRLALAMSPDPKISLTRSAS